MENQLEKKFPKGALSFYIKIYCKRKGDTQKKHMSEKEAMKSWISLTKSEKQLFVTKYNEYQSNFKKNIAFHLKNAEPYLRSKVAILNRNGLQNDVTNTQETDKEMFQNELISSKMEIVEGNSCEENTKVDLHNFNHEISVCSPVINATLIEAEVTPIAEPTAPKIISSKDLFHIIKERENNDLTWEKLTLSQKGHYRKAVLSIKKNYLKQYRIYLENLSSEKLFYHYRNIVNSV